MLLPVIVILFQNISKLRLCRMLGLFSGDDPFPVPCLVSCCCLLFVVCQMSSIVQLVTQDDMVSVKRHKLDRCATILSDGG